MVAEVDPLVAKKVDDVQHIPSPISHGRTHDCSINYSSLSTFKPSNMSYFAAERYFAEPVYKGVEEDDFIGDVFIQKRTPEQYAAYKAQLDLELDAYKQKTVVIHANYSVRDTFEIPDTVRLLPIHENVRGAPWSWWVVWGTLYYLDSLLVEHEIQPVYCASDAGNFKRPSSFEITRE